MAMTIHPAVSGTRQKWLGEAALFLTGAFVGAFAAIIVLAVIEGALLAVAPDSAIYGLVAGAIIWAVLADLGLVRPLPYRRGQVPESWRNLLPSRVVATLFGLMLGFGFITFFTYSAQLSFLLGASLDGSLSALAAVSALFAVGKTVVLIEAIRSPAIGDVAPRLRPTKRGLQVVRLATAIASLAVAVAVINPT